MGPIARMLDNLLPKDCGCSTSRRCVPSAGIWPAIEPIEAMGWPLRVGVMATAAAPCAAVKAPPQILITTPESLTLLLCNRKTEELFGQLDAVVLDEWHELMGSKRGSQCELCLSWLRQQRPALQTWAISATIGNLKRAATHALGVGLSR